LPKAARGIAAALAQRVFGIRHLWRTAFWGVAAAGSLALVVYTGTTQTGRARITVALAQVRGTLLPGSLQQVRALDVKEGRQLAERVKYLMADRNDMVTRLAMLERGTEELKAMSCAPSRSRSMPRGPARPRWRLRRPRLH
jgi:hypothetical protein